MEQTVRLSPLLLPLSLVHAACALAPGMRMDESAAEARARSHAKPGTEEAAYKVQPITAELVTRLALERRWAKANAGPDPLAQEARDYVYRVAPFDVLTITVWGHPELTIPAGEFRAPESAGNMVGADGTIFYPYIGLVEVAGKTLSEIRALLAKRLSEFVERPQLDVRVAAFRGKRIEVGGQVMAPSMLPITDVPLRVQDAIAAARGPTPEADLQHVTLTRDGTAYQLNILAALEAGEVLQNWLLKDGDMVYVPDRRQTSPVIVMGEVRAPAVRVMQNGRLSLAEALSGEPSAPMIVPGGPDPINANPAKIYVLRGDYNTPKIYRLDASSPDAYLLAVQFPLQPRDVVFVSTNDLARWSRVLAQILPTVQGIWYAWDITWRTSQNK
jgi:polysaccharide export outer membrane protein